MSDRKPFMELSRSGRKYRLKKFKSDNMMTREQLFNNCVEYQPAVLQPAPLPTPSQDLLISQGTEETAENLESIDCSNSPLSEILSSNFHSYHTQLETDSESDPDVDFSQNDSSYFQSKLQEWAVMFQITHIQLCALLSILRTHQCFKSLPNDSRTLLRTPRSVTVRSIDPGSYYHIGLRDNLNILWQFVVEEVNSIQLLINFDGLPLFKSNTGELWPILAFIMNVPSLVRRVFPIGIYYGPKKPESCNLFLRDFVNEMTDVVSNGVLLNGKNIAVVIKGICCDAPAKAFILGIKNFNGYFSCTKCKQKGLYYDNRMIFTEFDCPARTNEEFLNRTDEEFQHSLTPLASIPGIDFVSSVVLDYMHLVCLGVMRTFMYIWMFAKPPHKFPHIIIECISNNLIELKNCIPYEMCRKPRTLEDIRRWKATEFRQFMLYTGPLVLADSFLPYNKNIYDLFLLLHTSMTILLSKSLCYAHRPDAKLILLSFVENFRSIYGEKYLTHNFHGLTHLAEDSLHFGPLDNCSAYKFENFLFTLKKLLRKSEKPLQQIINRLSEMSIMGVTHYSGSTKQGRTFFADLKSPQFSFIHTSGPAGPIENLTQYQQYKFANFKSFKLSTEPPNNCCRLNDGTVALIKNFVRTDLGVMKIVYEKFMGLDNLYTSPLLSSQLGIQQVDRLAGELEVGNVVNIKEKMVLLSLKNKTVVFPFLHLDE